MSRSDKRASNKNIVDELSTTFLEDQNEPEKFVSEIVERAPPKREIPQRFSSPKKVVVRVSCAGIVSDRQITAKNKRSRQSGHLPKDEQVQQ